MLKRIKIRGKLLLLLLTPLLAVLLFAFSGVVDRTDDANDSTREARIAEFAEASGDLSTALQIERFQTVIAARLMLATSELRADEIATDEALARWIDTTFSAWDDFEDPALREQITNLRARLVDTIDADRRERFTPESLATELNTVAQRLNDVLIATNREATGIELFRALDATRSLITIQEELVDIAIVGDRSIVDGEIAQVTPLALSAAVSNISSAYDAAFDVVDTQTQAALDQLLTEDLLPRLVGSDTDNRGGFNPTEEIGQLSGLGIVQGSVEWTTANEDRLTGLNNVLNDLLGTTAVQADLAAQAAEDEASQFLILAVGVVVLALVMAIVIGRSVSKPLTQLTTTARRLSGEELPAMVESMRTGGRTPAPSMTPIRGRGRDEVAQLSRAFSEIQSVTVEVAEEQGTLLRRGISDIFVNLARRNQSLLDRQIDFIDQLESREENPDQLENLFRLDHLATRMRRNAESLLVLAGAEPTRRRGRPVELADVVRVAMGEIEDFSRIQLVSIDSATVAGSVAVDLAHLMSELMENATQFSPPDTDVEVVGHQSGDGSYQLTLSDRGIGMSAEQLSIANQTLAEPPIIGLELSRSLGFTVVSRLAHRLGVAVRLTSSSEGGVTALVTVPSEMVGLPESQQPAPEPVAAAPVAPVTPISPSVEVPTAPVAETPAVSPAPVMPEPPAPMPVSEPAPPAAPAAQGADGLAALPTRKPRGPQPVAADPDAPKTDGDLFEVFAGTEVPPAPPADPTADLFAVLDGAATGPVADTPTPAPAPVADVPAAPAPESPFGAVQAPPAPASPFAEPAAPAPQAPAMPA
ncbi:MAG: ATP-binding protein, partial [Actinomycetota bacterium]